MVSKNQTFNQQLLNLSGLKSKTMTPRLIDASSYISPLANNQSVSKKRQQLVKQFYSAKWQNGSSKLPNRDVSPLNGHAIKSPEIMHQQPLKRQSPKFHNQTPTKADHFHNHNLMFQLQTQQSQIVKQQHHQQQRNSPSRVSPTVKGSSGTPVNHNNVGGYAGAKFSEPPSPNELPKPPTHWMNGSTRCEAIYIAEIGSLSSVCNGNNSSLVLGNKCCTDISDHLKILLNMQA